MIRFTKDGAPVILWPGRMAMRYHISGHTPPQWSTMPPKYALCTARLPYLTRGQKNRETVHEDMMCVHCRARAQRNGFKEETFDLQIKDWKEE